MKNLAPPQAGGAASTALLLPLHDGQVYHLVFSNKTKHDGLCLDVREKLATAGLNVWLPAWERRYGDLGGMGAFLQTIFVWEAVPGGRDGREKFVCTAVRIASHMD